VKSYLNLKSFLFIAGLFLLSACNNSTGSNPADSSKPASQNSTDEQKGPSVNSYQTPAPPAITPDSSEYDRALNAGDLQTVRAIIDREKIVVKPSDATIAIENVHSDVFNFISILTHAQVDVLPNISPNRVLTESAERYPDGTTALFLETDSYRSYIKRVFVMISAPNGSFNRLIKLDSVYGGGEGVSFSYHIFGKDGFVNIRKLAGSFDSQLDFYDRNGNQDSILKSIVLNSGELHEWDAYPGISLTDGGAIFFLQGEMYGGTTQGCKIIWVNPDETVLDTIKLSDCGGAAKVESDKLLVYFVSRKSNDSSSSYWQGVEIDAITHKQVQQFSSDRSMSNIKALFPNAKIIFGKYPGFGSYGQTYAPIDSASN